jgi:hypothetical protein
LVTPDGKVIGLVTRKDTAFSGFPQFDFVDKNNNNWKLSNLDAKWYKLPDDGWFIQVPVSGFDISKIDKPKSDSLEIINTDPRHIMDLIL